MFDSEKFLNRFLQYVKIWTTSDSSAADSGLQPSTDRQLVLAEILKNQLIAFGAKNVQITEHGYVYGKIASDATPDSTSDSKSEFCLMAHLDTSEEVSGENVNPVAEKDENGHLIVKTDGKTLLGADDKAGITAIMAAIEFFCENPSVARRNFEVVFSPDEETGHGMDNFENDLLKTGIFESKCAYTVDGENLGELETECFNAYKVDVKFSGFACHTGSAKDTMINAIFLASDFLQSIPENQRPETTELMEGFYAPVGLSGSIEESEVSILVRDFDKEKMKKRLEAIKILAENTVRKHGGKYSVAETFQYENMREGLEKNPKVVQNLVEAYKKSGIEPVPHAIRGGTDGSRLTEIGIPTPNIFTGGHNFHSKDEWCDLNVTMKAAEILVNLIRS